MVEKLLLKNGKHKTIFLYIVLVHVQISMSKKSVLKSTVKYSNTFKFAIKCDCVAKKFCEDERWISYISTFVWHWCKKNENGYHTVLLFDIDICN